MPVARSQFRKALTLPWPSGKISDSEIALDSNRSTSMDGATCRVGRNTQTAAQKEGLGKNQRTVSTWVVSVWRRRHWRDRGRR